MQTRGKIPILATLFIKYLVAYFGIILDGHKIGSGYKTGERAIFLRFSFLFSLVTYWNRLNEKN